MKPNDFATQFLDLYIKKCFSGNLWRPLEGKQINCLEGSEPLRSLSEHLKTIAECAPLEFSDKLEEACDDWHQMPPEEKNWELSDRLETIGIS